MADNITIRYNNEADEWKSRAKLPSGMTGIMTFKPVEENKGTITFNVSLKVVRKRNREPEFREVTGRDGLIPAVWAMNVLKYFEEESTSLYSGNYDVRMEITADDERRWRIYERVLTRKGYNATMVGGCKTLVKKIGGSNA